MTKTEKAETGGIDVSHIMAVLGWHGCEDSYFIKDADGFRLLLPADAAYLYDHPYGGLVVLPTAATKLAVDAPFYRKLREEAVIL